MPLDPLWAGDWEAQIQSWKARSTSILDKLGSNAVSAISSSLHRSIGDVGFGWISLDLVGFGCDPKVALRRRDSPKAPCRDQAWAPLSTSWERQTCADAAVWCYALLVDVERLLRGKGAINAWPIQYLSIPDLCGLNFQQFRHGWSGMQWDASRIFENI